MSQTRIYALVVSNAEGTIPPYAPDDVWRPISQSESGGIRVTVIDPNTGAAPDIISLADGDTPTDHNALVAAAAAFLVDPATGDWVALDGISLAADDQASALTSIATLTGAALLGYDGAGFARVRVPNVTKIVSATASGNTTVWTPTAGKKFRLQRGTISVAATAAALTPVRIRLTDGAGGTVLAEFRVAVDTTLKGDTQIPFDFGNGELSAAANNLLVVNLDTELATGACAVNVSGTEE